MFNLKWRQRTASEGNSLFHSAGHLELLTEAATLKPKHVSRMQRSFLFFFLPKSDNTFHSFSFNLIDEALPYVYFSAALGMCHTVMIQQSWQGQCDQWILGFNWLVEWKAFWCHRLIKIDTEVDSWVRISVDKHTWFSSWFRPGFSY